MSVESIAAGGTAVQGVGGSSGIAAGGVVAGVTAGAPSQQGGAAGAKTVAAPTSGLGIKITSQVGGNDSVRTSFSLTNEGGTTVDLSTVTIRYYFTMDKWSTPVFTVDSAGLHRPNGYDPCTLKSQFFTVVLPNADRYVELSFVEGLNAVPSLRSDGYVDIQTRLNDQAYTPPNVSNDYSFVGVVGYTDRITVYVSGQRVWGVEPGAPVSGGGGAAGGPSWGGAAGIAGSYAGRSSSGGAPSGGVAGATGDLAGAPGQGGVAGAMSGGTAGASSTESAGTSGAAAEVAGAAGASGAAGSS